MFDILTASRLPESGVDPAADDFEPNNRLIVEGYHYQAQRGPRRTCPVPFSNRLPEVFLRERAGFDVILGNPPWEKTQVEEHAFWGRYQPGLRGLSQSAREDIQNAIRHSP